PFQIPQGIKTAFIVVGLMFAQFMAYREVKIKLNDAQTARVVTEPPAPRWKEESGVQTGPFGPILAFELVQEFGKLPKPCNVRVSHQLPNGSPSNLIWIDVGPGSPWKK